MSPGARTIPAAMVLPTAAEMPNQTPRTFNKRPREFVPTPAPAAKGSVTPGKDASEDSGNQESQDQLGNAAIINDHVRKCKQELAPSSATEERTSPRRAHEI